MRTRIAEVPPDSLCTSLWIERAVGSRGEPPNAALRGLCTRGIPTLLPAGLWGKCSDPSGSRAYGCSSSPHEESLAAHFPLTARKLSQYGTFSWHLSLLRLLRGFPVASGVSGGGLVRVAQVHSQSAWWCSYWASTRVTSSNLSSAFSDEDCRDSISEVADVTTQQTRGRCSCRAGDHFGPTISLWRSNYSLRVYAQLQGCWRSSSSWSRATARRTVRPTRG